MSFLTHRPVPRGQAAVEALLAVTALSSLLVGVMTIGSMASRGHYAASLSRLVAFTGAHEAAMVAGRVDAQVSTYMLPLQNESTSDDSAQRTGRHVRDRSAVPDATLGAAYAATLASDWLPQGHIRRVHITLPSISASMSDANDKTLSRPSVRRFTAIAAETGYQPDATAVLHRINQSHLGWSRVASRSHVVASRLMSHLWPVDQPVSRGSASTILRDAWGDLPSLHAGTGALTFPTED